MAKVKTEMNEYVKAIKQMLKLKGLEATNLANHRMLEIGVVPVEYFQAAARVLAKEIMK